MRRTLAVLTMTLLAAPAAPDDYLKFMRANMPLTGGSITGNLATVATLGAELAPALTGASGVNWTYDANWSGFAGTAVHANGSTGTLTPTAATTIVAGTTYKVAIVVSALSAGTATYTLGGVSAVTTISAATTYTEYITATTTGKLIITPATGLVATISSISYRALTDATGDVTVDGDLTVRSGMRLEDKLLIGAGKVADPAISSIVTPTSGIYFLSGETGFSTSGVTTVWFGSASTRVASGGLFGWSSTSNPTDAPDLMLARSAAATLQIGAANAASPVAQTLTAQGCRGGTDTDCAAQAMTIGPTATAGGTGTGLPARVRLMRGLRTTTGTGAQAAATAWTACGTKTLSTTSATVQPMITIATTTTSGGAVDVFYAVTASDGTNVDTDSGRISVSWNNLAATVAATASTAYATSNSVVAPDTLAATPTATVATNVVTLNLAPTWANTTPTTVTGYVTVLNNSADSVSCQ